MSDHETWQCRRCGEHHPVSRTPSDYQASIHFQQQFKFRDPPDGVVEDCIGGGAVKRTTTERYRLFEAEYPTRGETWRIVAALRPRGHHDGGEHEAVTIYETGDPPDRNF